jgi:hypothetical protein
MSRPYGEIRRCFLNVNMGNRHDGLHAIAVKAGVKPAEMSEGSYLVFVNRARDKIAMLVGPQDVQKSAQTMAYVRLEPGRKVDMRVIREIPRVFDGKAINYDQALKIAVDTALAKKGSEIIEAIG